MIKLQDAYKWNKNLFLVENHPEKIVGKLFQELEPKDLGISIAGLSQIFHKELPLARRALWMVSLVLCCTLVLYYVTSRVIYILSLPTQVAVTLRQNDSLVLPDVTLCPMPLFPPFRLKILGMSADGTIGRNFTFSKPGESFFIDRLWKSMALTEDIIAVTLVNLENSRPNWRLVFTTMGVCFRHHYNGSIQSSGINFGLQLKIDWSKFLLGESQGRDQGLKIFLHPGKDEALTEIDGIQITPGEDISIAIRLKEFQSLNRSANPCMYASAYSKSHCVNRCFQGFLAEVFGKCYLPFMGTFLEERENFTRCETPESYNQAMMEFNRQRFNGTLWAGCERRCLIECNKIVYTPFVESVAPSLKKISKLVFYFPEMSYEIVQEKEAYDLIALLCDVGGTFGLFLGCSILTLVELLEFIVIFIFKKNA